MSTVNAQAKPPVSQWVQFDGSNESEVTSFLYSHMAGDIYGSLATASSPSLVGALVGFTYDHVVLVIPVTSWVGYDGGKAVVLSDTEWNDRYVEIV